MLDMSRAIVFSILAVISMLTMTLVLNGLFTTNFAWSQGQQSSNVTNQTANNLADIVNITKFKIITRALLEPFAVLNLEEGVWDGVRNNLAINLVSDNAGREHAMITIIFNQAVDQNTFTSTGPNRNVVLRSSSEPFAPGTDYVTQWFGDRTVSLVTVKNTFDLRKTPSGQMSTDLFLGLTLHNLRSTTGSPLIGHLGVAGVDYNAGFVVVG
jgi:hypothetical protein